MTATPAVEWPEAEQRVAGVARTRLAGTDKALE